MTDRTKNFSRRNMFALTAGGASALAVSSMLGRTAFAAGPKFTPLGEALLPKGLAQVPGDLQLDPAAEALARKLLLRLKKSVLDSTMRPGEVVKGDSVAAASSKLVGSLRKARVSGLRASLTPGSKFTELADIGKVEPAQAHKMYAMELGELAKKVKLRLPKEKEEAKKTLQVPLAQKIEFHLNSVKCIDTTSGSGSDEIMLGGTIITPGGVVKKINHWKVADGFNDGDRFFYDFSQCKDVPANVPQQAVEMACPRGDRKDVYAGRKIAFTRLNNDIPWPATIAVVLTMGEQDGGGFNQFVQETYAALESEIKKQLDKLGIAAGEAIGTVLGPELGAIIGAVIGEVLGEFLDWLIGAFDTQDDLIGAKTWTVQLGSPRMTAIRTMASGGLPSPAGTTASKMKTLAFRGDGGKYELNMHWRIYG